eukprot:TRINITY_DN5301_c0_g1_i1.p1 TRINITY_DN5301_c0_g1~~TRINITY_DN5301_c0_g1_i1.p1  ORF type:complete len:700 (+),score=134.44 TRINITY_DN5301_c0_g1_i1:51-2150(+)
MFFSRFLKHFLSHSHIKPRLAASSSWKALSHSLKDSRFVPLSACFACGVALIFASRTLNRNLFKPKQSSNNTDDESVTRKPKPNHPPSYTDRQRDEKEEPVFEKKSFWAHVWLYVRLFFRAAYLGLLWVPLVIFWPFGALFSWIGISSAMKLWQRWLAWTIEASGPAFVKLGQWVSTRPDLFSEELCQLFARLQDSAWLHSDEYTKECIQAELPNANLTIGPVIGSGAIAQVHKATLPNQEQVAVKVLHPGIRDSMELDLAIIRAGASILNWIPGVGWGGLGLGSEWVNMSEGVEQFSEAMRTQLDLRNEAANLDRFIQNFRKQPRYIPRGTQIRFPVPIHPHVSRSVLVETYERGLPLSMFLPSNGNGTGKFMETVDMKTLEAAGGCDDMESEMQKEDAKKKKTLSRSSVYWKTLSNDEVQNEKEKEKGKGDEKIDSKSHENDNKCSQLVQTIRSKIARVGVALLLKMTIDDNFVHTDLHPGNLLVELPSPSNNNKLTLVVLDAGLVMKLTEWDRENFLALFGALVQGDGREAAKNMHDNARVSACPDLKAFQEELHSLVKSIPLHRVGEMAMGPLLHRVLQMVRKHRIKIETNYTNLVITMAIMEGVGLQLDPTMSIVESAIPVLLSNSQFREVFCRKSGRRLLVALENLYRSKARSLPAFMHVPWLGVHAAFEITELGRALNISCKKTPDFTQLVY